jgi:hypothetical protein
VKKTGRDEPIWVVIHMCMEAMLAKMPCFSYLLVFSPTKSENRRVEEELSRSRVRESGVWGSAGGMGVRGGGRDRGRRVNTVQIMYTRMKLQKILVETVPEIGGGE